MWTWVSKEAAGCWAQENLSSLFFLKPASNTISYLLPMISGWCIIAQDGFGNPDPDCLPEYSPNFGKHDRESLLQSRSLESKLVNLIPLFFSEALKFWRHSMSNFGAGFHEPHFNKFPLDFWWEVQVLRTTYPLIIAPPCLLFTRLAPNRSLTAWPVQMSRTIAISSLVFCPIPQGIEHLLVHFL